jgi:hypothetical protein
MTAASSSAIRNLHSLGIALVGVPQDVPYLLRNLSKNDFGVSQMPDFK